MVARWLRAGRRRVDGENGTRRRKKSGVDFPNFKSTILQQLGKVVIPRMWGLFKAIECLIELVHMIGEIGILEPRGLFAIHQLINGTIKKSTFRIHLLQLEIMMRSISNQQTNRFKARATEAKVSP